MLDAFVSFICVNAVWIIILSLTRDMSNHLFKNCSRPVLPSQTVIDLAADLGIILFGRNAAQIQLHLTSGLSVVAIFRVT